MNCAWAAPPPGAVIGNMVYAAIQADSTDWRTIWNKVQTADYFARRFQAFGRSWQTADLELAWQALDNITSDPASTSSAIERVDQLLP